MPALFEGVEAAVVRGVITRVVWKGNGRAIVELRQTGGQKVGKNGQRLTAVGDLAEPVIGQELEFSGELTWNDRFRAHQLRFTTYRTILPTDTDGIARYLIDVAKWVGPSVADQLVKAFGAQTLDVLKHHPERVRVKGLTAERVAEMQAALLANEKLEAVAVEVNQLLAGAVGPAAVRKAIKKWGLHSARTIKRDPYRLTTLHGIGFATADAVAKKLGHPLDARRRHAHAIRHVLAETAGREGHTRILLSRLQADATALLGGLRPDALTFCRRAKLVHATESTVAARELLDAEQYVAGKLTTMLAAGPQGQASYPPIPADGLAADQAAAAALIERSPVAILTGAPGTGKTYTVARIVKAWAAAGLRLELCAPTGKAAKQISLALADVCPRPAATIHRLLGPTVDEETGEFSFGHNEADPLEVDGLIIDEFSMVDARLAASLLRATPGTARVLIVGDHYQLPSVGPGAVLRDLLAAGVPSFELKEIKRNAGRIVRACHAIKDGCTPEPSARLDLDAGENWRHVDAENHTATLAVIETLLADKLPALGLNPTWDVQLVSPTNEKGPLSCDVLNNLARGILNPAGERFEKLAFGIGDKVVRCKNGTAKAALPLDPDEAGEEEEAEASNEGDTPSDPRDDVPIVNGDIGVVKDIDSRQIEVAFRYPARRVSIPRLEHHLKLAYCLTCHKMQGSEVPVVVLPLHASYARLPLFTREWLYTAISRAKTFIVTVGDLSVLGSAVRRVGTHLRQTSLRDLMLFESL